ncbi:MAG: T9SS type A sorting domain-containing protein [Bacteroidetes bacterium]|nr:T9SS type A sorting domain-containing protein [Bacteroidota bacterium]
MIIYDFDGLNIGQTNLPDGDYKLDDLSYQIASNPLNFSKMLGDRVLKINLNWNRGSGTFGKGMSKFIELDVEQDYLNFYIYNPLNNSGDASVEVAITEDDNGDFVYNTANDDIWKKEIIIKKNSNWQLISIPLKEFTDGNTGGNGIFDAGFADSAGMVLQVRLKFTKPASSSVSDSYFIDMLCFSEGRLRHGASILDLPEPFDKEGCRLGAHSRAGFINIGPEIEGLFPYDAAKKLKYIHSFHAFSNNGQAIPNNLPGNSIKTILEQGYRPIITLEPLFSHLPLLHPSQPRLQNIINGDFDNYLFDFGKKLGEFNDTIILRIMHEFDGNWYPWSISQNGQNPKLFIQAYQKIADVIRSAGADKVLMMWSPNSSPVPSRAYNWSINAYPGDDFVDIVGTSIYNHPLTGSADWKSFRYLGAEIFYYLEKYFPKKPIIIAELGIRERYSGEPLSSQTKGGWIGQMDNDLQSLFSHVKGLVFFHELKEHDWRINSSPATLAAVREYIWNDNYYFNEVSTGINYLLEGSTFKVYPNPSKDGFTFVNSSNLQAQTRLYAITGQNLQSHVLNPGEVWHFGQELIPGLYILEISHGEYLESKKLIKR